MNTYRLCGFCLVAFAIAAAFYSPLDTLINKTNILYQYSLICGPDFYNKTENIWSFPTIPNEYKHCQDCNKGRNCYRFGDCCVDVDVSFPARDCSDIYVYSDKETEAVEKYEIVMGCPNYSKTNLYDQCIKSYKMEEKIRTPPVFSWYSGLTYKNRFCALCNNITDFIPWKVQIIHNCSEILKLSSLDIAWKTVVNGNCGSIKYYPDDAPAKPCGKAKRFVDKCNVTGTWKQFDKDIEFACRNFGNSFKHYKNVFCYICNPPNLAFDISMITKCNVTGNWKNYNETMERACHMGHLTTPTYPYKNIYCRICNTATVSKNTYFLNIISNTTFQYFIFDISDGNDVVKHGTDDCDIDTNHTMKEFHVWKYRIDCPSLLPISIFDNYPVRSIQRLSINCRSVEKNSTNLKLELTDSERNSFVFKSALVLDTNTVYFVDNNNNTHCYRCDDVLSFLTTEFLNVNCTSYFASNKVSRYPFEYMKCRCSSLRQPHIGTGKIDNILYLGSYTGMTGGCNENEIFDSVKERCRRMQCFNSKKLFNSKCVSNEIFLPRGRPVVGYTLPFRFDVMNTTNHNEPNMDTIIQHIKELLNVTNNISASVFPKVWTNGNRTSFILQLDDVYNFDSEDTDQKLNRFISDLANNMKPHNLDLIFDSITMNFTELNLLECQPPGWRPLVSPTLICPGVQFDSDEYVKINNFVKLMQYENKAFDFYQYHIDLDKKLWICKTDFENLLKDETSPELVYLLLLVICNVTSVGFLLLTLLTYCLFSTLRTIPGKNIMSLSVSLILHYITFILVMTTDANGVQCVILGILAHYFLLTSFGCLCVCAWHMFKIFGTTSMVSSMAASKDKHSFVWYLMFAYGYSFIVIIGNIIVNKVVNGTSIGYGDGRCFISYKESIIVTLIFPLTLLSFIDIVLYLTTVFILRGRPRMRNDDKIDNNDFLIFLKLFTTTGCAWILLLVNVFVNNQTVVVIISCLNGLQGLCIFVAYIFNKRIYNMYKLKFRLGNTDKTTRGSPSTSLTSLCRIRTSAIHQCSPLVNKTKNVEGTNE